MTLPSDLVFAHAAEAGNALPPALLLRILGEDIPVFRGEVERELLPEVEVEGIFVTNEVVAKGGGDVLKEEEADSPSALGHSSGSKLADGGLVVVNSIPPLLRMFHAGFAVGAPELVSLAPVLV